MTILVTGGSKGIGRGIAERFARDGDHVLVAYSSDDAAAKDTASAIAALGGTPTLIKVDLSTPGGIVELGRHVRASTDHLDQLVYGAVWAHAVDVMDISAEDLTKALFMNGGSLVPMVQELRPLMSCGSSIYQISSRGSKLAVPDYVAIGAPKALGEALVRYLSIALARDGIRVNTVACSGVLTDAIRAIRPDAEERHQRLAAKNPSGRSVDAADVGELIHSLSRPELEMLTGREIFLDGGLYTGTN